MSKIFKNNILPGDEIVVGDFGEEFVWVKLFANPTCFVVLCFGLLVFDLKRCLVSELLWSVNAKLL